MIVADANVLVRGLRSRNGASHIILRGMLTGDLAFAASPAVILEYEDVLKREGILGCPSPFTAADIDLILDGICKMAVSASPWFRFRPFLNDPKDDLYIECALAAGADTIVTDDRHFKHAAVPAFGLAVVTPGQYVTAQVQRTST